MQKYLREMFKCIYLDFYPNDSDISLDADMELLNKAFFYSKVFWIILYCHIKIDFQQATTEAVRNALFQWFYLLVNAERLLFPKHLF